MDWYDAGMNTLLFYQVISVLGFLAIGFAIGFLYRAILKAVAKQRVRQISKNIGTADRWTRALVGGGLFVWAAFAGWSPILLIGSGFCFFEAIFSWCGLYAAIGKNTCPIE